MITQLSNKQQSKADKELAAYRLRQARIDAGYPTANHASVSFGWSIKTYLQHEEAKRPVNAETALKYSKAFKVSSVWLLGGNTDV